MLLHDFFTSSANRLPTKTALVREGRRTTYADLARQAGALAQALQQRGVRRGDRVALFLDNSEEMVASIFAVLQVGAVFMPVNTLTKADKLAYMLNDAQASGLITQTALAAVAHQALAQAPSVHTCWMVGGDTALEHRYALETPYPAPWLETDPMPLEESACIDLDLAAIIYTSGSTGHPKGVMLTHLNMVTAQASVSQYLGLREDDVIACALPLAFDYGLYQVLMAFKLGATVMLERSFTYPVKVLETMVREGATVFPGVPTMFALLMALDNLASFDLRRLRLITNTAAALPEAHIRRIRSLFPQAQLFSMYGLTECKRVTYLPPDQLDIRPTSVGRGMPNEEVWLVDEAGQRLPNGGSGELVIRGSHVMRGYWNKPRETAERLRPGPIAGEMVLYSGDIFRTDAEGYLYFVARKDDIIKSRGEKVSPREVENILHELPGVIEVAVVGVDDALLGQAVKAFIVLAPGRAYTERDVIKHCHARMESFMAPKLVEFVGELPRTDTGKIKKTGLR